MPNCCPACIIIKYREWVGKVALKKAPIMNEWLLTSQSIHNIDSQSGKLNECNQDSDYFSQEVCVRKRGQTFVLLGILRPIFYSEKWLTEMYWVYVWQDLELVKALSWVSLDLLLKWTSQRRPKGFQIQICKFYLNEN